MQQILFGKSSACQSNTKSQKQVSSGSFVTSINNPSPKKSCLLCNQNHDRRLFSIYAEKSLIERREVNVLVLAATDTIIYQKVVRKEECVKSARKDTLLVYMMIIAFHSHKMKR